MLEFGRRPPARVAGVARLRLPEQLPADRGGDPVGTEKHVGPLLPAVPEAHGHSTAFVHVVDVLVVEM
jgi:hypothetical protein